MVDKLKIGITGIQGAISEHVSSMRNTFKKLGIQGEVIVIKDPWHIDIIDGLVIPGGESTTISNILYKSGLFDSISNKINENNLPIMGTCAGCVLLANKIVDNPIDVKLFSAMDMKVRRNAFGRQKESFECDIHINGFSEPYNAVFIRAPIIENVWGKCKVLAKIENKIIMARQNNLLALSFHPELTNDIRIHKYFLDMI